MMMGSNVSDEEKALRHLHSARNVLKAVQLKKRDVVDTINEERRFLGALTNVELEVASLRDLEAVSRLVYCGAIRIRSTVPRSAVDAFRNSNPHVTISYGPRASEQRRSAAVAIMAAFGLIVGIVLGIKFF